MPQKIAVVTGCLGFIVKTFTEKLLSEGWYVYGIDKNTYVANKPYEYERLKLVNADIKDINWLPNDVIFNFAAECDVDNGNRDCSSFVRSNIDGVRNLLSIVDSRIVIRASKPLFFQISTDEVYGDLENDHLPSPLPKTFNPYSATKAAADLLIQSWARTHKVEYIIARPSNNYGLYQYPEKLSSSSKKSQPW